MSSINVLVVDDLPLMRSLLVSTLRSLGIDNIQEAGDSRTALALFKKGKTNIAFLDINMPDMDGLTLMTKLRDIDPAIFVIMVSGESSLTNVKKSIALGAKGFIVKPYTSGRVKNMIDKYQKEHTIEIE
ncbi:MAG: two-component system chemotaxis response regulator CheY [Oleiphilaceae bacterium]|jgi:two-component system chemotaxis response regulator CheY